MKQFAFTKDERLSSKKAIEAVFGSGNSLTAFPFKLLWNNKNEDSDYPAKVVFIIPKKNFKRAVDRNKVRRRLKEIYRLNKAAWYECLKSKKLSIELAILYLPKDILEYDALNKYWVQAMEKFMIKTK